MDAAEGSLAYVYIWGNIKVVYKHVCLGHSQPAKAVIFGHKFQFLHPLSSAGKCRDKVQGKIWPQTLRAWPFCWRIQFYFSSSSLPGEASREGTHTTRAPLRAPPTRHNHNMVLHLSLITNHLLGMGRKDQTDWYPGFSHARPRGLQAAMDLWEEVHNRWQIASDNIARSADLEERVCSRLVVTIWASSLAWWDANCYPAVCTGTHHRHPGTPGEVGGGERLWRRGCRQPASGCVCVRGRVCQRGGENMSASHQSRADISWTHTHMRMKHVIRRTL